MFSKALRPPRTGSESVSIHTRFVRVHLFVSRSIRRLRPCGELVRDADTHRSTSNGDYVATRGATVTAVRRVHEMECARRLARDRDAE